MFLVALWSLSAAVMGDSAQRERAVQKAGEWVTDVLFRAWRKLGLVLKRRVMTVTWKQACLCLNGQGVPYSWGSLAERGGGSGCMCPNLSSVGSREGSLQLTFFFGSCF